MIEATAQWVTTEARLRYGDLLDAHRSPLRDAETLISFAHRVAAYAGGGVVTYEDIIQDMATFILERNSGFNFKNRALWGRIIAKQPDRSLPGLPSSILTEDDLDTMMDLAYIVGEEATAILEMHLVQGGSYAAIAKELDLQEKEVKRIATVAIAKIRIRGEIDARA